MFGDTRVYDILAFADTELELRKADAEEVIVWTRLERTASADDSNVRIGPRVE
jgi:hypothetical protein